MGLFDFAGDILGGNTSSSSQSQKSSSSTNSTTNANSSQTQNQQQTAATSSTGSSNTNTAQNTQQQQQTTTNTLSQPVQQALTGAITSGVDGLSYKGTGTATATNQQGQLVSDLQSQNAAIPGQVSALTDALTKQATLNYNQNTLPGIISQGNSAGGLDNSFTQLLQAKGQEDLQTQIAGIGAQTQLQGLQLQSQNNATIANADNSYVTNQRAVDSGNTAGTQALAFLTDALKGATTTSDLSGLTSSTGTSNTNTQQNTSSISDLISALTGQSTSNTQSTTNSTGNVQGNNTGTALSGLDGLLGSL